MPATMHQKSGAVFCGKIRLTHEGTFEATWWVESHVSESASTAKGFERFDTYEEAEAEISHPHSLGSTGTKY